MPKLEELRDMFRPVASKEEAPKAEQPSTRMQQEDEKLKKADRPYLYSICSLGQDAELKFGKHKGEFVSQLAKTAEGLDYLKWMAREDFPGALMKVVKYHIQCTYAKPPGEYE